MQVGHGAGEKRACELSCDFRCHFFCFYSNIFVLLLWRKDKNGQHLMMPAAGIERRYIIKKAVLQHTRHIVAVEESVWLFLTSYV